MDFIKKHQGKVKYLFLLGAIIAGFNTLSRADYNFVLYLYMFYVWVFMGDTPEIQQQDKLGTFYLIFYSLFVDLFWCLFWGGKWDAVPTIAHELILIFSWLGVINKILVFVIILLLEFNNIKASWLHLLKAKQPQKGFVPYNDDDQF